MKGLLRSGVDPNARTRGGGESPHDAFHIDERYIRALHVLLDRYLREPSLDLVETGAVPDEELVILQSLPDDDCQIERLVSPDGLEAAVGHPIEQPVGVILVVLQTSRLLAQVASGTGMRLVTADSHEAPVLDLDSKPAIARAENARGRFDATHRLAPLARSRRNQSASRTSRVTSLALGTAVSPSAVTMSALNRLSMRFNPASPAAATA
jgi:hypothetical protein